jgi:hypothetical protein
MQTMVDEPERAKKVATMHVMQSIIDRSTIDLTGTGSG